MSRASNENRRRTVPETAAIVSVAHGCKSFEGADRHWTVVAELQDDVRHELLARSADDV